MKNYNKNMIALSVALALTTSATSATELNTEKSVKDEIEVIVVKGAKRPKTLQEVPASVTVIGGEDMRQMKIDDLEDLSSSLPNVNISANAIQDTISIRGINSDLQSGGEQSVGIFVDGIYHGRGAQSRFSFLDVETVEVLRGPQGALFGKNTIAGVIAINPAQAKENFEAKVTVSYEVEYEETGTNGYVTGALNDDGTLTGRLAYKYSDRNKEVITNIADDTDLTVSDYAYRGILNWQASDKLTINLRAEQGNQENNEVFWEIHHLEALDPSMAPIVGAYQAFGVEDIQNYQTAASQQGYPGLGFNGKDTSAYMDTDFAEYALKADYRLDSGTITLQLANSSYDFDRTVDADFGPLPLMQYTDTDDYDQNSAELRFVSNNSDSFEYIVGLYYQDSDLVATGVLDAATNETSIIGNLFNSYMPLFEMMLGAPAGAFADVYPQYDITTRFNKLDQSTETLAIFGQVGIGLTDSLKLELSGRYSDEDKTATQSAEVYGGTGYGAQSGNTLLNPLENAFWGVALFEVAPHSNDLARNETHFSPSASLSWTVNDDTNLYAAYSKGFKSGGYNTLSMTSVENDAEYEEEEANSYEIGGKFSLFDGSSQLNFAIFRTEFDNMQTTVFTGGTTFVVDNAAEAISQGVEMDFTWLLSDEFTLYSNVGYIDFEFESYKNAGCTTKQIFESGLNGAQCSAAHINDLSGKTNQDVPEFTAMLGLEHDTMINDYQLVTRVNVNYTDDYFGAPDLDPQEKVEGYSLVDATIRLVSPDEDWSLALIGRNLTSESPAFYQGDVPLLAGTHMGGPGAEATYTLQFSYHFID